MLKLIRAFLTAGVMENGLVGPVDEGTPQGGPLSPLLSNLVLDELDRELEQRKHCFVRYADDCNIYVRSRRAGERVKRSITCFITRRLKLKVNEAKSAVARPVERKFLGFSFTGAKNPQRRIAAKALMRFKQKVRELTGRTRGISIEQMTEELTNYLRVWPTVRQCNMRFQTTTSTHLDFQGCAMASSLIQPNRRMRTRTFGGVGGEERRLSPLSRYRPQSQDRGPVSF